jgi:hypothetical protein
MHARHTYQDLARGERGRHHDARDHYSRAQRFCILTAE